MICNEYLYGRTNRISCGTSGCCPPRRPCPPSCCPDIPEPVCPVGKTFSMTALATSASVASGDWIGIGTSSADFNDNSFVVPAGATLTGIVLNIRDNPLDATNSITATVYESPCGAGAPVALAASAVVAGPNPGSCSVAQTVNVPVTANSLVSVQITFTDTGVTLPGGVAVTLLFTL